MRQKTNILLLLTLCGIGGAVYYAWQAQWIILNIPGRSVLRDVGDGYTKKDINLYCWHNNQWIHERTPILLSCEESFNVHHIAQAVLNLLSEKYVLKEKITLLSVVRTYDAQQLIIFLDRAPFLLNMSIQTKLMIVESILKTLRENGVKTPLVNFFVGRQPMQDAHLDFSVAWPLQGFFCK